MRNKKISVKLKKPLLRGLNELNWFNISLFLIAFLVIIVLIINQSALNVFAEGNGTNDSIAPITESSFTSEEWQNSDISISLNCEDNVECYKTFYCIDASNSCSPITEYSGTITHENEGTKHIRFYSVDTSENQEDTQSQILKLDKTLPEIEFVSPTDGQEITGIAFTISGTSDGEVSGINKVEVLINDVANDVVGNENWQYLWKDYADGMYSITAKVIDNAGNEKSENLEVTVNNPPSARIVSLGDPPLVTAARTEVEVQTSEPVQFTPTLSYSFPGQGGVQIPLAGSSQTWKGFMIISDSHHDNIGTFKFSATDLDGKTGSIITEGNYFVVDAIKPEKVVSVNAEVDGDDLKLIWFYEGEELKQFNIYRSSKSVVDYAHYYKTAPADVDSTSDDLDGKTYYYRIAAVDLAGNIGPLSEEVVATSSSEEESESTQTTPTTQTTTITPTIPNSVARQIDSAISNIDREIVEIDKVRLILEKEPASKELGLILEINSIKSQFNSLKEDLDNLRSGTKSITDIEKEVQRINIRVTAMIRDLPKDISLESESSFVQETSLRDIEEISNLFTYDLTPNEREFYIIHNQRLQSRAAIKVTVNFYKVLLVEGEKDITLIKKEISSSITNSSLIEVIPKTMASSASQINFITQGYKIIEEDPIIEWKGDVEEIKYYVEKKVSDSDLRQAKTLVLSEGTGSYGLFTGLTVAGKSVIATVSNLKILIGLVFLALLIVFYFVYLRDTSIPISFRALGNLGKSKYKAYKPGHYSHELYKKYQHNQPSQLIQRQNIIYPRRETRIINRYATSLNTIQKRQLQSLALMPEQDFAEHFNEIAEKTHNYANEGNFSLASKSYSLLLDLYKKINASSRREAYNEILKVYNKLNLYSKIKELHSVKIHGMNLRNLLEHVSDLYSVVSEADGKDTKLLRFAREYYDYAISRFNSN